tara:strand:+ start:875 stop:1153 length:279 start_codon:yes stop_codon:yes gene_type:complete
MNSWKVVRTDTFLREFKKYRKNKEFINALDKKIKRLKENPEDVGGYLSGRLHGYKSTRIVGKLRLIFKVVSEKKEVYLSAIDHRKFEYKRFN